MLDKAQTAADIVLSQNPQSLHAIIRMGHTQHAKQQYLLATDFYQRALSWISSGLTSPTMTSGSTPPPPGNLADLTAGIWSALTHCWLMLEDLPKAFHAYQQALAYPSASSDIILWFCVGVIYYRYGADGHAFEAFSTVLKLESFLETSDASNSFSEFKHSSDSGTSTGHKGVDIRGKCPNDMIRETYYRLGQLFRIRRQFSTSIQIFKYLSCFLPPPPLSKGDVCIQIEVTRMLALAEKKQISSCSNLFLSTNNQLANKSGSKTADCDQLENMRPNFKSECKEILENLKKYSSDPCCPEGCIYYAWALGLYSEFDDFEDEKLSEIVKSLLSKTIDLPSVVADSKTNVTNGSSGRSLDPALSHYILGRVHFSRNRINDSHQSYQAAVNQDSQNFAIWNSIGILFLKFQQFRDALDNFTRAVHLNSTLWEIWWNLGVLYELGNGQKSDVIDAYRRAHELCPYPDFIQRRIDLIESSVSLNTDQIPSMNNLKLFEIDPLAFQPRSVFISPSVAIPSQKQPERSPQSNMTSVISNSTSSMGIRRPTVAAPSLIHQGYAASALPQSAGMPYYGPNSGQHITRPPTYTQQLRHQQRQPEPVRPSYSSIPPR